MRSLLLVLVLLGCGKVLDKPPGEVCTLDTECTDPALPFCVGGACSASCEESSDCVDPAHPVCAGDGACVGCEEAADCTGAAAPICDTASRECRGCSADSECISGVCIEAEGGCVADDQVAFVADMGADSGDCTRAAPCATVTFAISQGRRVIKVLGGNLMTFNSPITLTGDIVLDGDDTQLASNGTAVTIVEPSTAIVEGVRVTVPSDPTIPAIKSSGPGAKPILHDITVVPGAGGFGIHVTGSSELTLQHSRIGALGSSTKTEVQCQNAQIHVDQNRFETSFVGVGTGVCEGTITRNRFESDRDQSIQMNFGPMVVENNLIIHNMGFNDSVLANGMRPGSTFRFNTMINTTAVPSDGAAISCDGTIEITSNVFAYNSGHPITGTGCVTKFSIFDEESVTSAGTGNQVTAIDAIFVNRTAGDFHLAADSIAKAAGEPGQLMVKIDFEGNPRPNPAGTNSDCGAFEAP